VTDALDAWSCLALEVATDGEELLAPERVEQLASRIRAVLEVELELTHVHRFDPFGFSLVALGTSGRLAIHTWPERRFATIDLWLGTPTLDARRGDLVAMLSIEGYRVTAEWLSHTNLRLPRLRRA
jgi:S-adenosylmethionine/arginine decarboxylase-like enzyme